MNKIAEEILSTGAVIVSTPVWASYQLVKGIGNVGKELFSKTNINKDEKKEKEMENITVENKKEQSIKLPCKKSKVDSAYNLDVINASMPASELVRKIENALEYDKTHKSRSTGIRILLYGVSGTGKTEFAKYLAERLNRKLDIEVASSVIMVYSGETENRINEIFTRADNSNTVLLFDEADSFFYNRKSSGKMWESRQVNEFLTQMEKFNGIVICTTNQRKEMDSAMQRRFDFMIEFKPVVERSIPVLLNNYFPELSFSEDEIESLMELNSITPGDFGLLQRRRRFMDEGEISSTYIVNELIAMQQEKLKSAS